jgi:hypothetical protein
MSYPTLAEADTIILELVNGIKVAIKSGDWKVDGACDPDLALARANEYLKRRKLATGILRVNLFE